MIKKCVTEEDKNLILEYIDKNYSKCLYLYMDLKKYFNSNPNVKAWLFLENDKITGAILEYYTGMHIYSKEVDFDLKEVANLIQEENPSILCGEKKTIDYLSNSLKEFKYENGWVRILPKLEETSNSSVKIEKAKYEDFDEIAELLLEDEDIGASYTKEILKEQLIQRNQEGYGKNYIVRDMDRIIAHIGNGAEFENISMINYVIVKNEYRGKGIATAMCYDFCKLLQSEGKDIFLINYSKESIGLYNKIGFKIDCEWAKLYKEVN